MCRIQSCLRQVIGNVRRYQVLTKEFPGFLTLFGGLQVRAKIDGLFTTLPRGRNKVLDTIIVY